MNRCKQQILQTEKQISEMQEKLETEHKRATVGNETIFFVYFNDS